MMMGMGQTYEPCGCKGCCEGFCFGGQGFDEWVEGLFKGGLRGGGLKGFEIGVSGGQGIVIELRMVSGIGRGRKRQGERGGRFSRAVSSLMKLISLNSSLCLSSSSSSSLSSCRDGC